MRARQREIRLVVIEGHVVPTRGSVTSPTIRTELAVMRVVLLMTGVAVCRRALEHIVDMALGARDLGVSARQLEGRQVVIEIGRGPACDRVAGGTILPKAAAVRIALFMAGEAVFGRRCEIRQRLRVVMASVAGEASVLPGERECKTGVSERLAKTVHSIMAAKTIRTVGDKVSLNEAGIDLSMTAGACLLIEGPDVSRMAILTHECRSIDVL